MRTHMSMMTSPALPVNTVASANPSASSAAWLQPRVGTAPGARRPHAATAALPSLMLVDDDPIFVRAVEQVARRHGLQLTSYTHPREIDMAALVQTDLALIDFDLGSRDGVEVAEQLSRFAPRLPLILVSYTLQMPKPGHAWPQSIKSFMLKDIGPGALVDRAIELYAVPERWPLRQRPRIFT